MDDSELQAIRAARLQEMQRNSQAGGHSSNGGGSGAGNGNGSDEAQASSANNAMQALMSRILEPEAKERLNRVRMVKPERVIGVENYLMRLYQSGGIRTKITEQDIVEILNKIGQDERRSTNTKIVFDRREYKDEITGDDQEEDDFFD